MPWDDYDYPKRESIAEQKAKAEKRARQLAAEQGPLEPALVKGVKIASTFWGQAWNRNLERYEYYEHRLPRGRSYVKNGLVLDLKIERGTIRALVSGTALYEVTIRIDPLDPEAWTALKKECSGQIRSLVGLLRGELPESVMDAVADDTTGLFPEPDQIRFSCTCPDDADLCKHCAAAAYGTGARLDEKPELLFLLRGVDHHELIQDASAPALPQDATELSKKQLDELRAIFGIELDGLSDQ